MKDESFSNQMIFLRQLFLRARFQNFRVVLFLPYNIYQTKTVEKQKLNSSCEAEEKSTLPKKIRSTK